MVIPKINKRNQQSMVQYTANALLIIVLTWWSGPSFTKKLKTIIFNRLNSSSKFTGRFYSNILLSFSIKEYIIIDVIVAYAY